VKEEGKQRAPTRLTIAAADCSIVITRHLATGPSSQFNLTGKPKELKVEIQPQKKVLITPASSRSLDSRSARDGVSHLSEDDNITSTSGIYSEFTLPVLYDPSLQQGDIL
jgi:hypothetical protein